MSNNPGNQTIWKQSFQLPSGEEVFQGTWMLPMNDAQQGVQPSQGNPSSR